MRSAGRLVIAVDGKAVRGANKQRKAPHLVAALALGIGAVLGQVAVNVKPSTGRLRGLGPWAVRRRSPPSVAVRAKSTVPHTAPWPRFPSAMRPWTPQHNALQRDKVTYDGTEQKRPASARIRS